MSAFLALYTTADSDAQLAALAQDLARAGWRLAGAIQHSSADAMALRSVSGGTLWPISQRLGAGAQGCSLDPGALETAVAAIAADLPGADLLIVNRFGKQEAAGRGFAPLIAAALDQGSRVLVSVAPGHRAAFDAFAGDLAQWVAPDALQAALSQPA